MKTHYINIALIAAAMLTGCNTVGPEEALMPLDDISLTIKGEKQFKYSKDNFQLGFNDKEVVFRVTEDKLAHWFVLDCNELPTNEDQPCGRSCAERMRSQPCSWVRAYRIR